MRRCLFCFTLLVSCPPLTDPSNGAIFCFLGNDGIPSYNDTCIFSCNTGYEMTGNYHSSSHHSDSRTCQSDGSWSGSNVTCSRGN